MIKEKDFEDILCNYSELIEEGLLLKGRQVDLYGRRMDMLFEDKFRRKLIVELKIGPIKDAHIGQILSYEGMLLSAEDPTIRVILIGNRVPPNIQKSLDHHGIAWKEIAFSDIKQYLIKKNDAEFLKFFNDEPIPVKQYLSGEEKAAFKCKEFDGKPALFVPVEKKEIDKAFIEIKAGKESIIFYTGSNVGVLEKLRVQNIYFKLKGGNGISVKADFIGLTRNPGRNPSHEHSYKKYRYEYTNLRLLNRGVDLKDLKYFESRKNLRNDVPGACIILDPMVE